MNYQTYTHRFADIILNSDYGLKQEIDEVISSITLEGINEEYERSNENQVSSGKRPSSGKQSSINSLFRLAFSSRGWEVEKTVFNSSENDLKMDFWKRKVGVVQSCSKVSLMNQARAEAIALTPVKFSIGIIHPCQFNP